MTSVLSKSLTRPATMDDVETVVDLLNVCAIEDTGKPQFRVDELDADWQRPGFSMETDTLLVLAPGGNLTGYAVVWDFAPHERIFVTAVVHPEHRGAGIGAALCQWVEERGRQSVAKATDGARVVLCQEAVSGNELAQALLQQQGYQFARYSLNMLIEMDEPPPAPVAPKGLVIRPFVRGQEERTMIQAMREAFRGHWGYVERPFEDEFQDWMHLLDTPDVDPALWFVAVDGDDIAGTSFGYATMAEDPELGWIWGMGVRRPWRRRGLALALLQSCFGALYRCGKPKVGLSMDAQNLSATRLYEKAGMHVDRQYMVYERELRPEGRGA